MSSIATPPQLTDEAGAPADRADRAIECPRCGYDLRGLVKSWRDSCPMQGVCTECGLEFEWSRLHSNATHPWLFEYHWRRRPVRSLLRSVATACRPKRFWSAVDLADPVHLAPAMFVALLMIALPLLLRWIGASVYLLAEAQNSSSWSPWGGYRPATVPEIMQTALRSSFWVISPEDSVSYPGTDVPWLILAPQIVLWWFAMAWPVLTGLCFVLIPVSLKRVHVRPAHVRRIASYGIVWMMMPLVAIAAVDIAALLANAGSIWATGRELYSWWDSWAPPLTLGVIPTLPFVFLPLAFWWWDAACRYYLKLPDSRLVAALLTLLSGLVAVGGFVYIAESLGAHGWWIDKL